MSDNATPPRVDQQLEEILGAAYIDYVTVDGKTLQTNEAREWLYERLLAWRDQAVREARKDELQIVYRHLMAYAFSLAGMKTVFKDRIKELEHE